MGGDRWRAARSGFRVRRPAGMDSRVLAFASLAMTMTVYGQTPGVAVFVTPLVADLGLDGGSVSAAYAVGSLVSAFALPYVGRRLDVVGVRTMTLFIAAAYGSSMVLLSGAQGLLWLAVGFAGLRLLGQGSLGLAGRNAVTLQFRTGLGRAVAISGSVAAIVSSVVPFLLAALISAIGWRVAWLGAALSVWAIVIPAAILLLPRPEATAAAADGVAPGASGGDGPAASPRDGPATSAWTRAQALRAPAFWLITLASAASAVILTGFAFHQISVLSEAGLSSEAAAAMFVPLTIASVGFLAVVAPLAGRWSSRAILAASQAPLIVAMVLVPLLGSALVPVVYACALGAALGAGQVLDGILYPRHFGVHAIGAIRGAAFTVVATASAVGPVIVGALHGLTGSYVAAALALVALPAGVVVGALLVGDRTADTAAA